MPKSKEICIGQTRILIFETPLNSDVYGIKKFRGKYVKVLDQDECERYKLIYKK